MFQNPNPRTFQQLMDILDENKFMNPAMNGFSVRREAEKAAKDIELAERLENNEHQD